MGESAPVVPADEVMSPAEFRVVREFLGFSVEAMAAYLDVSDRTVRYWESGKYAIPDGVRLAVEDLEERTGVFVGGVVDQLMDLPEPTVLTYRSDREYRAAHPEAGLPAAWHRAVIARVALEVHGLRIEYADVR